MPLRSDSENFALIRVIGVGGGGSNAVNRMIRAEMMGVEFIACNTDAQALLQSDAPHKIRIGDKVTRGLGAGGDAAMGQRSAEEDSDKIASALADSDMVFITAGLGGGTGSGAAPIVAQIAKDSGALTIGVVTKPFAFEGNRRKLVAEKAAEELKAQVDALITIPNDRLKDVVQKNTSILDAFRVVDDVLRQGVQGISDIITVPGLINRDFADVRAVMKDAGSALMGIARATGENRAVEAAQQAIASPLLELDIHGAQGILWNITGSSNLSLFEVNEAAEAIKEAADPEALIMFGTSFNERLGDEVMVTVIATGFDGGKRRTERPPRGRRASWKARHRRASLTSATSSRSWSASASRVVTAPSARRSREDEAAALVSSPRIERTAGENAARRPRDVRRRRPRDPELPPPQVTRAGATPAAQAMTVPTTDIDTLRAAHAAVLARIAAACARVGRDPGDVTLVAVSKEVDASRLRDAVEAGIRTLGENRVQEGESKVARGRRRDVAPDRSAPIEQGPPGARGVRPHPVRRLRRAGRAAGPPRSRCREAPARLRATRSCSRSMSTTTRRRPASPRPSWTMRSSDRPGSTRSTCAVS